MNYFILFYFISSGDLSDFWCRKVDLVSCKCQLTCSSIEGLLIEGVADPSSYN